jgi:hypothetical protein
MTLVLLDWSDGVIAISFSPGQNIVPFLLATWALVNYPHIYHGCTPMNTDNDSKK